MNRNLFRHGLVMADVAITGAMGLGICTDEEDNPVVEPEHPFVGGQENKPTKGATLIGWRNHSNDSWYVGVTIKPDYCHALSMSRKKTNEKTIQ